MHASVENMAKLAVVAEMSVDRQTDRHAHPIPSQCFAPLAIGKEEKSLAKLASIEGRSAARARPTILAELKPTP